MVRPVTRVSGGTSYIRSKGERVECNIVEREERESKLKERFLFMLIFDWITNDAMQAKVVKVGSSGGGAANKRWSTRTNARDRQHYLPTFAAAFSDAVMPYSRRYASFAARAAVGLIWPVRASVPSGRRKSRMCGSGRWIA